MKQPTPAQQAKLLATIILRDDLPRAAEAAFDELCERELLRHLIWRGRHHRVAPLLAARAKMCGFVLDSDAKKNALNALDDEAAACQLRNALLRKQLSELAAILSAANVPFCVIKGAVSLVDEVPRGYLPREVRPMSDIDIVVRARDADRARAEVARSGWLCTSGSGDARFSLDSPAMVDVHGWRRDASLGFLDESDFFEGALKATIDGVPVTVPRPRDSFQLRLCHNLIHSHLFIDFPLMELLELASFAAADKPDWARTRSVMLLNNVERIFYCVAEWLASDWRMAAPDWLVPEHERVSAERVRQLIRAFEPVPERLYCAAARNVLLAARAGDAWDKVEAAGSLFARRDGRLEPLFALRMLGLHFAAGAWLAMNR